MRRRYLTWGATDQEVGSPLAGDDLISNPDMVATRAIAIRASAERVWPWIAQLGQGRGGFYSYDWLENLVGCDIHSSDRILREWQDIFSTEEGDLRGIFPTVMCLWPGSKRATPRRRKREYRISRYRRTPFMCSCSAWVVQAGA